MPKKSSQVVVEKELSDDEIDQVDVSAPAPAPAPVVAAEPKKKYAKGKGKERSPAQQESFSKALTILKEKRESKVRDEQERFEKATAEEKARIEKEKYEKAKNHKKRLPPAPSYVTMTDLEKFKHDILNALPKAELPKPVLVAKTETPVKEQSIPEPIAMPKRKVEPIQQKSLTGHDLLDKLFFN